GGNKFLNQEFVTGMFACSTRTKSRPSKGISPERGSVKMQMPWGKFKGRELTRLPVPYLRWLRRECKLDDVLAAGVEYALRGRIYDPPPVVDIEKLVHEI